MKKRQSNLSKSVGLKDETMDGKQRSSPLEGGLIVPDDGSCLGTDQLNQMEYSFRQWAEATPRHDIHLSRRRILLIFQLIRHTGAKLHEILTLDPYADINIRQRTVSLRSPDNGNREITLTESLVQELDKVLADSDFRDILHRGFAVDPAFVRRKFYERAEACGFPRRLGGPEMIRRARAVELMQHSMPLPAVQKLLGHSSPNLTSAYVSFSDQELQRVTTFFLERETNRTTSARNSFFGKIVSILRGDIQSQVQLIDFSGHTLTALITNDSLKRLDLYPGRLLTAEVKAPWVMVHPGTSGPQCSAENRFPGVVVRINRGQVSCEYVIRIDDHTELCAVLSTEAADNSGIKEGDPAWALFNCFAVILHADQTTVSTSGP